VKNEIARRILHVLAHLFVRVPYPSHITRDELHSTATQGQLILDPLPNDALDIINKHNQHTLQVFTNYYKIFARTYLEKQNPHVNMDITDDKRTNTHQHNEPSPTALNQLPISAITFPILPPSDNAADITSKPPPPYKAAADTLYHELISHVTRLHARSPFVGLSGESDVYPCTRDLIHTLRNGIYVNNQLIPTISHEDMRGRGLKLNAYVVDFYRHQSFRVLLQENRLGSAQAWALLKEWEQLLLNLAAALNTIAGDDSITHAFNWLATTYQKHFKAIVV